MDAVLKKLVQVRNASCQAFIRPHPRKIWEWAEANRIIAKSETAKPGRYRTSTAPYQREPQESFTAPEVQTTVLYWAKRLGKALDIQTPIPTPFGWKKMGDLKEGDFVFGSDGKTCKVTFATETMFSRPCNRVVFSDGAEIIADDEHLWDTIFYHSDRRRAFRRVTAERKVSTTKEISKSLKYGHGESSAFCHSIPCCRPLEYQSVNLPIAPYTLGVWLGDGSTQGGGITFTDQDAEIIEWVQRDGFEISVYSDKRNPHIKQATLDSFPKSRGDTCDYGHKGFRLKHGECGECLRLKYRAKRYGEKKPEKRKTFRARLAEQNLIGNKHIPEAYLQSSIEQRTALFQGLMDTDGHCTKQSVCEFTTTDLKIAEGFLELALSLGFKATSHQGIATLYGREVSPKWRITFTTSNERQVFRLKRKQARLRPPEQLRCKDNSARRIVAVIPVESRPVRCIQVDSPDHCYLAGTSFIATHNTVCIENLHGATMDENPRNILHVMPTLETIVKWSKQFLTPLIEGVESLFAKVMKARSRDSGNTIRSKRFPGGTISGIGTNSPSGFRQVQAPVVTCDEVDAMEDGPEGDPVFLAFGRSENYEDSVQVVSSTATRILFKAKDGEQKQDKTTGSRIHDWWLKSDQRKWFALCPDCKERHVLMWENVKWPKIKTEDGGHEHQTELAWYECPKCKSKWDDKKRIKAVLDGEWKATAPFKGVRGYWLNGLNTTFPPKKGYKTKLHQMAAEFLDALRSGEKAFTVWKNTFLCEPIEAKAESVDPKPLLERREVYLPDKLPTPCALIACVVDVQGDRLELDVIAMGEGEETWAVEHRKLIGDPERDDVWKDLNGAVTREYTREDGVKLKASCVAIDLGFKPKRVRNWIKTCGLPRVYGVYGTSGKQVNLVIPKYSKHYGTYSYSINTDSAKDTVFARLKLPDMGPRFMHFGREQEGFDTNYFDQLTAEEKRVRYVHGFPQFYYEKVRPRNEALDQRVYFLAAMDILRPNIKAINDNLLRATPNAGQSKDYVIKPYEPKKDAPAANVAQRQAVPRRGRVVGGRGVGLRGAQTPSVGIGFGNLGVGSYKI